MTVIPQNLEETITQAKKALDVALNEWLYSYNDRFSHPRNSS